MNDTPTNAIVWTEIPVTDLERAMTFYAAVTGVAMVRDETGAKPVGNFNLPNGGSGHLYVGTPAPVGQGPIIHLAVAGSAEDAIARCTAAGGTVISPVIAIPPGRFALARDLDGNAIGLFEPAR